jgi:serine/threonine protein kinase
MALAPGARLGPYEIVSALGAGGMGEVYRARDTRLDRQVALKVISADAADDAERLARFEQEARAAAKLNHTNIVAVFDVGQSPSGPYIVSELLEGESLQQRLARGRLPVRSALSIGAGVARGLAAAHDQGIVHRDLKPANIFVTADGTAKILDFGIAKLRGSDANVAAQAATQTMPARPDTAAGVVLGSVGYMAPEQVRGEAADTRADIFAMGCVLYEMLTGRRAFAGNSAIETLHAILTTEPPEPDGAAIPAGLDRTIRRCLEKNPAQRFQSAHDLAFALDALGDAPSSPLSVMAAPVSWRMWRERMAWTFAFLAALAAALSFVVSRTPTVVPAQVSAVSLLLPPSPPSPTIALHPTVAPDGRSVVYAAANKLWVRPIDAFDSKPLDGSEGASQPFWSPDSQTLAFFADGQLKKIDAAGGLAQVICPAPRPRGGAWGRDDVIVFSPNQFGGLYRVSAHGGTPTPVTKAPPQADGSYRMPHFLPDGRRFVFLITATPRYALAVGSVDASEPIHLMDSEYADALAPPDFLVFVRGETLMAQPFDQVQLKLTGEAVPIASRVGPNDYGNSAVSLSDNGVLLFRESARELTQLGWFSRSGAPQAPIGVPGPYLHPRLDSSGRRLALGSRDPDTGRRVVVTVDLGRNVFSLLTDKAFDAYSPEWAAKDEGVGFASSRRSKLGGDIFFRREDTGREDILVESSFNKSPSGFSGDGRWLLFQNQEMIKAWSLVERTEHVIAENAREGQISPDGRFLAFQSNATPAQVFLQAFPSGPRVQVSTSGGVSPRWRRDGRELYFIAGQDLMAVSVGATDPLKQIGLPVVLFRMPSGAVEYDVADGQRFVIAEPQRAAAPSAISVIFNWTSLLKR